jgi:hypothetical protein
MTSSNDFDPEIVAAELAGSLSARTRHICAFLGGGAPHAAGLPDLAGLQAAVVDALEGGRKTLAEELFKTKNLEATLSYLRRLVTILEGGQMLGAFSATSAAELHGAIIHYSCP